MLIEKHQNERFEGELGFSMMKILVGEHLFRNTEISDYTCDMIV
ncbi:hypothetical protein NJ7G_2292 [Natrinema sp. J7-2]|nr:hypothetical protein NJ7G_2292 [Natrinema sp. J7-2]